MSPPLILGSSSPRRAHLLAEAQYAFQIAVADVNETLDPALDPPSLTLLNARLKASPLSNAHPGAIILTADTLVYRDHQPLGKPRDLTEAAQMLQTLSGRFHEVCTGVCLTHNNRTLAELAVVTQVWFKPLTSSQISDYHRLCNPLDKAGAYGIQTAPELIIDRIWGSHSNVVGLPMDEVRSALSSFAILPLSPS